MTPRTALYLACTIGLGLGGCGGHASTSTSRNPASSRPTAPAASSVAAAIRALASDPHTTTAHIAYRLNAGPRGARRLARWRAVFPPAETSTEVTDGDRETITERTATRQVEYVAAPHPVSVVADGRRRSAKPSEVRSLNDALAARRDLLARLASAPTWRVTGTTAGRRRLTLYPAPPALAADLVPGYARHPSAVRQPRLRVDAEIDAAGHLTGLRAVLSCLVDLNAISARPRPRPAWIGLAMLSVDELRYGS